MVSSPYSRPMRVEDDLTPRDDVDMGIPGWDCEP